MSDENMMTKCEHCGKHFPGFVPEESFLVCDECKEKWYASETVCYEFTLKFSYKEESFSLTGSGGFSVMLDYINKLKECEMFLESWTDWVSGVPKDPKAGPKELHRAMVEFGFVIKTWDVRVAGENRPMESLAARCVEAIIADMTDRRGLRQEWDQIDEGVQDEIRNTWKEIIQSEIEKDGWI